MTVAAISGSRSGEDGDPRKAANRRFAFLRAINVGGRTVRMERLREIFAALGFAGVETFIASGNVIFEVAASERDDRVLERTVEAALREGLGFEVVTFIRSSAELARIATHEPFPRSELDVPTNDFFVTFLRDPPAAAALDRMLAMRSAVDDLRLDGTELYWLRRRANGESGVDGPLLERALKISGTMRNMNTVRRLVARFG